MATSSLDGSGNNKCEAPTQNLSNHRHDEKYYYPDDSAVFLVDGVLFKVGCAFITKVLNVSNT